MSEKIARTGNTSIDVSGYVVIDSGAGDIYLEDDGTGFGILSNSAGNLEIKSGNTTALSMTGANVAAQGNLSVAGSSTLDGVTITDNTIKANASNADLQIGTAGTGVIDILTATQSTVGSSGGASALPGQPNGYI